MSDFAISNGSADGSVGKPKNPTTHYYLGIWPAISPGGGDREWHFQLSVAAEMAGMNYHNFRRALLEHGGYIQAGHGKRNVYYSIPLSTIEAIKAQRSVPRKRRAA